MAGQKYNELPVQEIKEKTERRLAFTDHLMMAIIDFDNGPAAEPDPPHSHPHEQVTYVASGEILFFLEDQPQHLCAGDVFTVPTGKMHTIQLLTKHVRLVDCFTPIREDFLK
jgi:quercetin dioxygenase-like cupin family protein